eukprot:g994.t1
MRLVVLINILTVVGAWTWYDVREYSSGLLHGKAAYASGETPLHYYERLPASAQNTTRASIWELQQQPAGMFVQFRTNSSAIATRYNLGGETLGMWHFPPTGVSGMDMYAWDEGNLTWRWTGTSHPAYPTTESTLALLRCEAPMCPMKTYRMHLPTYNSIHPENFSVGLASEFDKFLPDSSHITNNSSIVWYGSSILQGAVASRPGMIMTHQVSRSLQMLVYNFGFSGNCLMEQSVAQYLVQIEPRPTMFIIDCNPNMDYLLIQERAVPLVRYIRSHGHPTTPIVLAEGTNHGTDWYSYTSRVGRLNKTRSLRTAFDALVKSGDAHLFYATADDMYSDSLNMNPNVSGDVRGLVDPTVGGTHPTDLGMMKQAKYWEKKIPSVFAKDAARDMTKIRPSHDASLSSHTYGGGNVASLGMTQIDGFEWKNATAFLGGRSTFRDSQGNVLPRDSPYDRLPSVAKADVREKVWQLSEMSTGMYLRFASNAPEIAVNHTLAFPSESLWHMPFSGTDGLDIYAWSSSDASWRHVPVTTGVELFGGDGNSMHGVFHRPEPIANQTTEWWTYLVYLPLRNAPKDVLVGIDPSFSICGGGTCGANDVAPKFDDSNRKPIVWYGTSIQQGGVASRAGNAYDAIISRALSVDIHNFGFAGNGVMELSVAKYLCAAEASIIVIDCLPNMNADEVAERTEPLVRYLRNSTLHRTTPIILAEGTPYPAEWLNGPPYADAAKNAALRSAFEKLASEGIDRLFYVKGEDLFKDPLVNPTVGGVHSSDLGQYEIADFYVRYLPGVLGA